MILASVAEMLLSESSLTCRSLMLSFIFSEILLIYNLTFVSFLFSMMVSSSPASKGPPFDLVCNKVIKRKKLHSGLVVTVVFL